MLSTNICPVCKAKKPKTDCIEDDTLFFCNQKCLDKSHILEEKFCPKCDKYFYSEDEWSGNCLYCDVEWWLDEYCTEDYSDCWLSTEWDY